MARQWHLNIHQIVALIVIFSWVTAGDDPPARKCTQKDECLCEFDNRDKFDISRISANLTRGNLIYIFSGCKDYVKNITGCERARLCEFNATRNNGTNLGERINIITRDESAPFDISFVNGSNLITSVCTEHFNSTIFTDRSDLSNGFYIFSPYACVVPHHQADPSRLSTGSVLVILLFVTSVIYFFGGAIVLHCIRGARGREMIPNIDFWQGLPGLMKDGLIFALNGCRPTAISTAETYDRI